MNLAHRWLCRSAYWRNTVETYILPWVLDGLDIGTNVLEVGPGPGVTTDLLRGRVERLTCVEIDRAFADSLSRRMSGHNVTVVRQDATAMSFPDATFDGAVSFTMLHHVPSGRSRSRLAPRRRFCGHGQPLQPFISSASPPRHNGGSGSMYISRAPQESGFC
jgi:phospholipid N-methyltransferase